jgi:hypothetical protein
VVWSSVGIYGKTATEDPTDRICSGLVRSAEWIKWPQWRGAVLVDSIDFYTLT